MKYIELNELKKELNTGNYGKDLFDYDCEVCEAIYEIADVRVDVYYYKLFEWAKNNINPINEAMHEGLTDGLDDITEIIQVAQYRYIEQDLYEHATDSILYVLYSRLENDGYHAISEELYEYIENDLNLDIYSDLGGLYEKITEYIKENNDHILKKTA